MELPERKRNRLPRYDYSAAGAYFITICVHEKKNRLCRIVGDGSPVPKLPGIVSESFIRKIPEKYPSARVNKYVIMPNHIHMILFLEDRGTGNPSPTIGNIIGWFKYQVTKQVNGAAGTPGCRLFQRSFHDHVIRGEKDYAMIWKYIDNNPASWADDCFFVAEPQG